MPIEPTDSEPAAPSITTPPTLAEFILSNIDSILADWQSVFPAGASTQSTLHDHARQLLQAVAADIAPPKSSRNPEDGRKGLMPDSSSALKDAGGQHGQARMAEQFDLERLVGEFRAVRASVLRRWASQNAGGAGRFEEIIRFNEAVDEALASAVRHHALKRDEARTAFVGQWAHDLRNPLHAALMGASYISQEAAASAKCIQAAARIKTSIKRCNELVSDLIDYARSKRGQAMPISPLGADMRALCTATADEVESANPGCSITRRYSGELNGRWDPSRIAQLLGNLLTNAVKRGPAEAPVLITASGANGTVSVDIHDDGPPIRAGSRASLFDPMYLDGVLPPEGSTGPGLGLYICREIALAHGGDINVTSDVESGTSFKFTLPQGSSLP